MANSASSATWALLRLRCPRCHEGPLFSRSAFNLSKFADMPEACPVCGQAYEPEPGFYWGAMYFSYGFTVAIFVLSGVLLYYLANDPPLWVYITVVGVAALLSTPLVFRYSRALMLYLFGGVESRPPVA
ncbi:DUF983 domain-containing protein [Hymenobacter latericus]|uniref:DUF983 domain-containing protein n=1 Tax=Hymenobacter sp. YIM 151858-1 TaxID=2987688 RepID=UPI002225D48D|nr:DUF983 domain-containing protein [Hymenobacter sp. YIM 151858-1]UYZ58973.1 DUF983 domain-containing protein [Hymenobacter sp. YIM 151858-1]